MEVCTKTSYNIWAFRRNWNQSTSWNGHNLFFACFDLEAFFTENLPSSGLKLSHEVRHVPMSVAIASCIPGKEPVCFASKRDLVKKMLDYLADTAYLISKENFQCFWYSWNQLKRHKKNSVRISMHFLKS